MSYGIINMGSQLRGEALDGMRHAAELEQRRNQAQQALNAQESNQRLSSAGSGAAIGFQVSGGNPIGAAVGAGLGLLSSIIF